MNIKSRKRYGQHFLHDKNIINRIIDNIDFKVENTLIEIGPGLGALTYPLLSYTKHLHVIEIDKDLADELEINDAYRNSLEIHREDALKLNYCTKFNGPLTIIGNLPYNISTPLLFQLLDHIQCIDQMLFMLQKEVADRICAAPGTKVYGRLTIMVQSVCTVQQLFNVSPGSFTPQPKVDSSVIKLSPRSDVELKIYNPLLFKNIVRAAFSKRRKTIRNALKSIVEERHLTAIGILPTTRPEQIPVESFVSLANQLTQK